MSIVLKRLFPLGVAFLIVTGVPYIKLPCGCGSELPLAFAGALLGCGGQQDQGREGYSSNSSVAEAKNQENAGVSSEEAASELKVIFVELGSVNCIPCRMMQPVMEQVQKTYPGQVKIIFHDVWTDQGRAESMKYHIRVIPTQVFLDKNGSEYFRHEGFYSFKEIEEVLKMKGVQ